MTLRYPSLIVDEILDKFNQPQLYPSQTDEIIQADFTQLVEAIKADKKGANWRDLAELVENFSKQTQGKSLTDVFALQKQCAQVVALYYSNVL